MRFGTLLAVVALLGLASCSQGLGARCTGDRDCPSPLRCELRGRPRGICTYSLGDGAPAADRTGEPRPDDVGVDGRADNRPSEARAPEARPADRARDQLAPEVRLRDQAATQ
jgi:hypothetical protein